MKKMLMKMLLLTIIILVGFFIGSSSGIVSNSTAFAAWWGATIATIVLLWDIYKWLASGPKISFTVSTSQKVLSDPRLEGSLYVTVRVVNKGDRPTTLTNFVFIYYNSLFRKLFNRPSERFVVNIVLGVTHPLPYALSPGHIWDGMAIQNAKTEEMARNGYLQCGIYHSASTRPVKKWVKLRKKARDQMTRSS